MTRFSRVPAESASNALASLVLQDVRRRSSASVEAVREMMGHSDLSSTARYLHATSQDKVRAIALLAGN